MKGFAGLWHVKFAGSIQLRVKGTYLSQLAKAVATASFSPFYGEKMAAAR